MWELNSLGILLSEDYRFSSLPLCRSLFTIEVFTMAPPVMVFTVLAGGSYFWGAMAIQLTEMTSVSSPAPFHSFLASESCSLISISTCTLDTFHEV